MSFKIGILAGEPSGDILGRDLIQRLRVLQPNLTVSGIGGPLMIEAGCNSLFDMERLSIMGFIEPLKRLPELINIRRTLVKYFLEQPPDVFIGIDSPDFNLGLELKLRKAGIPTIHYVSPSVWAWRQKRIYKIAKATDLVLTLLPFEAEFYHRHRVPVQFVGHPLADIIPLEPNTKAAREALNLPQTAMIIALLPGSRGNELKHMADLFIQAAKQCYEKIPEIIFITSAINQARFQQFKQRWQQLAPELPIQLFTKQSHHVMAAADVVLVTSGTATLETMLYKKPMVIAYRIGRFTYQLAKRLIKIPFIGLPNLLAKEKLVPEFIQDEATPTALADALLNFIAYPEKIRILERRFATIHQDLKQDASHQAAQAIINLVQRNK